MKSDKRTRVMFILPTLYPGGSERIVSYIAQNIDSKKFKSYLVIIGHKKDAAYKIKGIDCFFLEKSRVLNGIFPLISIIKKFNPDITLSVIGHLNTVMAYISLLFPKTKFISREATVLSYGSGNIKKRKKNMRALIGDNRFRFFDKIICQSRDMLNDISESFKVEKNKLIVVNNPITNENILKKNIKLSNKCKKFITIARLSKEKGVLRLIKLLSKLDFPFHYTLVGDGTEKNEIFTLIKKLGLESKITHIPFTDKVNDYLADHHFFLQGSYVEGFPNALLESCVVGTPVIAFDVPGGTKEIVENGVNGYLVKNEEEFLEKLKEEKEWNPKTVSESVYNKFNKEKIIREYEQLFLDVLK